MTDLESGANQTNIRIAWQAVLPEGPGPTVYTVSYSNGVTAGTVPGCQRLAALTCTHAGVPYDGLTYTYTVVAANQPGERARQPLGAECRHLHRGGRPPGGLGRLPGLRHRQQPGGGGAATPCPTRAARPARSTSWSAGWSAEDVPQQTGATRTASRRPSNEQPYPVQLRVCNEKAPAGCTLSGVQNVQTYGRLDGDAQRHRRPVVNGKT